MYKQEILYLKRNTPLYTLALDMGISETSLRKYLNSEPLGEKTLYKIERYIELNYTPEPNLEDDLRVLLSQYGYKLAYFEENSDLNSVKMCAFKQ